MLTRRAFLLASARSGLALAALASAEGTWAQRPANPIARPPRPGGMPGPGRFPGFNDGVVRPTPPGLFVVRAVDDRENIVQLCDADGRTAGVFVDPDLFDVSELKPGDEIEVDFVVPESKDAPLRAAGVWRK